MAYRTKEQKRLCADVDAFHRKIHSIQNALRDLHVAADHHCMDVIMTFQNPVYKDGMDRLYMGEVLISVEQQKLPKTGE